ncbi:MAG: hypothetical protein U0168_28835 [Nannocystaceae bacterium]
MRDACTRAAAEDEGREPGDADTLWHAALGQHDRARAAAAIAAAIDDPGAAAGAATRAGARGRLRAGPAAGREHAARPRWAPLVAALAAAAALVVVLGIRPRGIDDGARCAVPTIPAHWRTRLPCSIATRSR